MNAKLFSYPTDNNNCKRPAENMGKVTQDNLQEDEHFVNIGMAGQGFGTGDPSQSAMAPARATAITARGGEI